MAVPIAEPDVKVEVREYEGCFGIDLTPETIEEAALLIRLGINGTLELRSLNAAAHSSGRIDASLVIGKRKQQRANVKAGKW